MSQRQYCGFDRLPLLQGQLVGNWRSLSELILSNRVVKRRFVKTLGPNSDFAFDMKPAASTSRVLCTEHAESAEALYSNPLCTLIKRVIEFFLHQHIAKPRVAVELIKPVRNIAPSAEPLKARHR